MSRLPKVPGYVVAFVALIIGITAGGSLPGLFAPVASGVRALLDLLILLVPLLILGALSPAIAMLIRRGLAGRFAAAVLIWFVLSTTLAGLVGILVGAAVFRLPISTQQGGAIGQAVGLLRELGSGGPTSLPVLAILSSVLVGVLGARWDRLYGVLRRVEQGIARLGSLLAYIIAPLSLALGVMMGVTFGTQLGVTHYGSTVIYALVLALVWLLFYVFVILRLMGGVRAPARLLKEYYAPTALFAAATCSSLATIPVNLAEIKKYGVRDEIADFVIPLGTLVHKSASAMQYMAYPALIAGYIFGLDISWSLVLLAWPFVALYSVAAPGVPGAMGLSLWTGVLYASLIGLEDPLRATFVGTWVALASGIPDMFRTSTNSACNGFASVLFDHWFDKYFGNARTGSDDLNAAKC